VAPPAGWGLRNLAAVDRRADELLDHEGVALTAKVEEVSKFAFHGLVVENGTHHLGHIAQR